MKKSLFLICAVCLGLFGFARAQVGVVQYFMDLVPGQNSNNPAFIAPYDAYFGFPAVSGIHAQVNNDSFVWADIIERGVDDSLRLNKSNFVGKLHDKNIFGVELTEEILRVGFKSGKNYFHVGLSAQVDANIVLTKPLLSFLALGPGQFLGENKFTGNSIDANAYAYLYFGWSRKISKMVTLGARVKLINGLYNISTKNLALTWNVINSDMSDPTISPYTYQLKVDGDMRLNIPITEDNKVGSLGFPIGKNWGFGIDMGVNVDFASNWTFSAAVSDIGAIFWKDENASVMRSDKVKTIYNFEGLGSLDFFNNKGVKLDSMLSTALTTVLDTLGFEKTDEEGYTTVLPTTFTIGIAYTLAEQHQFGAIFKGRIMNSYFAPEVGLAYTYTPCKNFAVSVSNTFSRSGALNLGLSLVGNIGPVQLYVAVDRINSFNVSKMKTIGAAFGINFVIGKHEILPSRIAARKSEKAAEQNMRY